MTRLTTIAFALLLAPCIAKAAAVQSPAQLLQQCQQEDLGAKSYCAGYITGVADANSACIPDDISADTLANLITNALSSSTANQNTSAAELVNQRLGEVFPCKKSDAGSNPAKKNWSNKERLGK
jgi:hypothetical protein